MHSDLRFVAAQLAYALYVSDEQNWRLDTVHVQWQPA